MQTQTEAPGTVAWSALAMHQDAIPFVRTGALIAQKTVDTSTRVVDLVRVRAKQHPDKAAIHAGGCTTTYRKCLRHVDAVRDELVRAGCTDRDVVACLGARSAVTPVLFLALEDLGAVYLPVDPAWLAARIAEVVEGSAATHLVHYAKGVEHLDITAVQGPPAPVLPQDGRPQYVISTSGPTGPPKGATVEQGGMPNHLWAKIAEITAADRVAFTAPLVFDISIWQMLAPLMVGATVVVVEDEAVAFPPRLLRLLYQQSLSIVELVPTAIGRILDQLQRAPQEQPLPSLRWLISTGEELRRGLAGRILRMLPHAALLNAYGPAECSDDVTHHVVTAQETELPRIPVGMPIANAIVHILVYEEGQDVWHVAGPGEAGEILVGGIPVGDGYLGAPDATRAAFYRDPVHPDPPTGRLYRTGRLGRSDRQVKVVGIRLELDEIEAVLSRHPALDHCAVVLVPASTGKPQLVAHFVAKQEVVLAELERFVADALPQAAVPRRWIRLDSMPLTSNGKVDHATLRTRSTGGEEEAQP